MQYIFKTDTLTVGSRELVTFQFFCQRITLTTNNKVSETRERTRKLPPAYSRVFLSLCCPHFGTTLSLQLLTNIVYPTGQDTT